MQSIILKGMPSVNSSINLFLDIWSGYDFQNYHYLKNRFAFLLLLWSDTICFDNGSSVRLYDNSFFQAQVPNTLIWKITTLITVQGLRAYKHVTGQYAISAIYIPAKNSQK